ncbi:MAG: hypothetical protein M0C28_37400 [Candidatus Moduliflexus flocculans]|nr:hypothetical protein [Candidatus Moduliflexus flocculans]
MRLRAWSIIGALGNRAIAQVPAGGNTAKNLSTRLWAVNALARLNAKEALLQYLLQEKNIGDPQDRFGEEAVESAAVRSARRVAG